MLFCVLMCLVSLGCMQDIILINLFVEIGHMMLCIFRD